MNGRELRLAARGWACLLARDVRESLRSPAPYAIATLVALVLTLTVQNYLATFETESVFVAADPAGVPLGFGIIIAALYAALSAAASVAGEKEHRTLEVLFCGPVGAGAFVLAKFTRDVVVFISLMCYAALHLAMLGGVVNIGFGWGTVGTIALAVPMVLPLLGVSLFISAAVRRARTAVLLVVIAALLLAAAEAGAQWAAALPPQEQTLAMAYLRELLIHLGQLLSWVSPLAYAARAVGLAAGAAPSSLALLACAAVAYAALALAATAWLLDRKGLAR
jgi:ABC-type transport system involved in multi-copper enzyme maturation permease subunit